jgi:hypothetical protein
VEKFGAFVVSVFLVGLIVVPLVLAGWSLFR